MCLIVRGRAKDLLSLDLVCAEDNNPDGFGIHTPEQVFFSFDYHSLFAVEIIESMIPKDTITTIHFRLATHGGVTKRNAHPFFLGDNVFLMHNGVLRGAEFDCPKMVDSDTAMLASQLRPMVSSDRNRRLRELAIANRFCLLRGDKWKKFGQWTYDSATRTWHSNGSILSNYRGTNAGCDPRKWSFGYDTKPKAQKPSKASTTKPKWWESYLTDEEAKYYGVSDNLLGFDADKLRADDFPNF